MQQYIRSAPSDQAQDHRPRQTSAASMNRYVPQDYPPPPPPPAPHVVPPDQRMPGYPSDNRPRGPSLLNQPIPSIPPLPQSYAPVAVVQPPPPGQLQPYPVNAQLQPYPTNTKPNEYMHPPQGGRRLSASSAHSRHSHDSQTSRHSAHSSEDRDRRRHSHDRADDDYDDRGQKPPHKHHHHHGKQPDDRPTLGDTMYGLIGVVKNAFGLEK